MGGFLGCFVGHLMNIVWPLLKNLIKLRAKSAFIPLILTILA